MEENKGEKGLENKKNALIERAKQLDRIIYGKTCEKKALQAVLGENVRVAPMGRLKADLDELEFKVATEAYTLELERNLLKKIKKKKEELEGAFAFSRKWSRIRYLEAGVASLQKQRDELEKELQVVKGELVRGRRQEERDLHKQERALQIAVRERVHRKEIEDYVKEPSSLELGDVAIIRKKKEGER
ncbi:MAG: hypothetical protein Q7T16_06630 [Candidatus Burarchaeum sp.]|nr:hypothetical protein [Candidatus Burarchaeum sp.]MDO8340303.1 hypothetical protein [Candidatus Burarchaeum sp.]